MSTRCAQRPLATPSITRIDNSGAGQLTLHATGALNASLYEVQG